MQETVRLLCHDHENLNEGLKVLNVGFGLGIVRTCTVASVVTDYLTVCRLIRSSKNCLERLLSM